MISEDKLKNKVCLVTGGTGVIGRAIVKKIYSLGASVIFTYKKNKTLANEILNELSDEKIVNQVIRGLTPPMPSFEIEPQSMADLLAYMHSLN